MKKKSDAYLKIVRWSDEDKCYVGSCPGLFFGGVHGQNEKKVYQDLCDMVDEHIKLYKDDKLPLPEPTNKEFSGKFNLRVGKDLHRALVVKALQAGESLNQYCVELLQKTTFGKA